MLLLQSQDRGLECNQMFAAAGRKIQNEMPKSFWDDEPRHFFPFAPKMAPRDSATSQTCNSHPQNRLRSTNMTTGITHAAVRLAGPSIKRSSSSLIAAAACTSSSGSCASPPFSWLRRPSTISLTHHSTASFSTSPPTSNNNDDDPVPSTEIPSSSNNKDHRLKTLSLYRQLLRGAERMPTPNRINYIKRKTRHEFRKHMSLTDQEEIDFQLRLADTNLDTVLVQAEHLTRLWGDPEYQNYN